MYWAPNSDGTHWYPIQKRDTPERNFCVYKHIREYQWYISTKYMGALTEQHIGPYKHSDDAMRAAEMLHEQGEI
jgi:hypothetical protein